MMVYPCLRIIYFCNANRRYRAPLPGHDLSASLRFTFLVYPLSLRATTTIYIVTGGAVLYSLSLRWGKFRTGEISRTNIRTRNIFSRGTRKDDVLARAFSRDHPRNRFAKRNPATLEKFTRTRPANFSVRSGIGPRLA